MDYFIIAKSQKNTKRDKKNSAEVEALLEVVKEKLKKNKIAESIAILEDTKVKDNYDINYLKGVCYLVSGQYHNGAAIFKSLINSPKPKKDIYLMLSVCFKKLEDYENTEAIVSSWLFSLIPAFKNFQSTMRRMFIEVDSTSNSKKLRKLILISSRLFTFILIGK